MSWKWKRVGWPLLLMLCFYSCRSTGGQDAGSSASNSPLDGYPTFPIGASFSEEFDSPSLNSNLFEIRDGYKIWDSWYDQTKITISGGKLLLSSDANDTRDGLVKVGGIKNLRAISGLENYDSTQMNTYTVEWKQGTITWTVNDIQVEQLTQAVPTTPMQIIIDTNHNKSWGEFVDPAVSGGGSLELEYIKYTTTERALVE